MSVQEIEEKIEILTQQWIFSVSVRNISPKERLFLTGSTEELGLWDYTKMVPLENEEGTDIWRKSVTIPNTYAVYYRYAICTICESTNDVTIRCWETILQPRVIYENMLHPIVDIFGEYDGKQSITTGWLTNQTLLQLKFINNPIKLKSRLAGRLMNIKVTPVALSFGATESNVDETSLSTDITDVEMSAGAQVQVSTLDNDTSVCKFKPQEQFGREYKPNDILLVNITAPNHKALAYLVDLYSYSSRAAAEDPPCHIGYTYVLPNMFKPSEGTIELPVTCNVKHRPLGTVVIEYLIIYPMPSKLCDMQVSYAKYWDSTWTGLEVGHRGLGASFKTKEGNTIRENTIASLKKAAACGADMLEFDVQLSKDMIPVIYHDFYVCISIKRKKEIEFTEMLELPVKDLTLEHLQKLKVYHLVERNHGLLFNDEELEEHQPFPTLEDTFNIIDNRVGFNVELKWNMEMKDGTFELQNPFDMNTYVDKVLKVVLTHAGERRVVFSCFNPDICTMVRYKQNKYPVMFLTVGVSDKYEPYRDPRCLSIPAAVQSAISADILGIVVHTEDLLRDPSQVKLATDVGLVMFCWGDDNNNKKTIKKLKRMGLHAVIYDKLDQHITKRNKESIFVVEARESQRDLMLSGLRRAESESAPSRAPAPPGRPPREPAPRGPAPPGRPPREPAPREPTPPGRPPREPAPPGRPPPERSTATSLESLASCGDPAEDRKRGRDLIDTVDKESQVKEQKHSFRCVYPGGSEDSEGPKKHRPSDAK